jgi:hypothetical protein
MVKTGHLPAIKNRSRQTYARSGYTEQQKAQSKKGIVAAPLCIAARAQSTSLQLFLHNLNRLICRSSGGVKKCTK